MSSKKSTTECFVYVTPPDETSAAAVGKFVPGKNTRGRMVSGLTVLRADQAPEGRRNCSYVVLVEEPRRIVEKPKKDAEPIGGTFV